MTAEHDRLEEARTQNIPWKKWGPYLSERQWGTVREDYSEGGDAWNYFTHDQARSRAYRWGEDGLAGISDDQQRLCFALALWNGKDPILKERLFGLTNSESNHGEDVKEYYFYLDSTPTHSYMKYLYKYPQAAFPYADLVETSRGRSRTEFEYELLDTGVFDENRYFDVFVEYAKESPEDILIQITVHNRGPEAGRAARAADALVPQSVVVARRGRPAGAASRSPELPEQSIVKARRSASWASAILYCAGDVPLLFTENETNTQRIFGVPNRTPYVKDGINNYVVHGQTAAVNPEQTGTKVAAHYRLTVAAGKSQTIRLRLTDVAPAALSAGNGKRPVPFGSQFDELFEARRNEADEFYRPITPPVAQRRRGQRHAAGPGRHAVEQAVLPLRRGQVAGRARLRSVQGQRASRRRATTTGTTCTTATSSRCRTSGSTPGTPPGIWPSTCSPLTLVDPDFGKQQLKLMLRERYMHPNGQIPAYEWNFGDVNPPVHAWSTIFTYRLEKAQNGEGDKEWLKSCFQKLLLNFTWWVNRKDRSGRNVFEGRLPGPRQHRRLRPQRAAADRRLSGAGRRHRLDGPVLPEHAGDRRRAGADRSRLRGHGAEVRRALPVDRLVDGAPGRRHRHVGRGGRLLLRRAAAARRPGPAAQGPVDGRPAAAVRRHGVRRASCWHEVPGDWPSGCSWFLEVPARTARGDPRPAASRASPAAGSPRSWTRPRSAACWRRCSTRTSSSARSASARCRASTPTIPTSFTPAARSTASPTCRPSPTPACSAATRTGAARSGCRSTP